MLSVLITCEPYAKNEQVLHAVYYLEVAMVVIFSLEYLLRVLSSSCHGHYKGFWGKLRFIRKPYMVIDIAVIVATTAVISSTANDRGKADYFRVSFLRFLRFLQVRFYGVRRGFVKIILRFLHVLRLLRIHRILRLLRIRRILRLLRIEKILRML